MKQKKITSIIVLLFLSIFILGISNNVQATQASSGKNLNIKFLRKSGYGYELSNERKIVWKIYEEGTSMDQTIYCLKGGPGFGSAFDSTEHSIGNERQEKFNYNQYFDLRKLDSITPDTYKKVLPTNGKYTSLMWILDNIYVPAENNASEEETKRAVENKASLVKAAKSYADKESIIDDPEDLDCLTDDDIDAVQQLAIWHFTNTDDAYCVSSEGNFSFELNSVQNNPSSVTKSLSDTQFTNGWERQNACKALFKYLVNTAESKTDYNYKTVSEEQPVELENTEIKVTKQDGRLIIGPYKLKETNVGATYTIEAKVTNGSGSNIQDVKYLEDNKNTANAKEIKDLVGKDFYISVPEGTEIKNIKLELSIKLYVRSINYWSETNPTPDKNQPVVIVENKILPFTLEKTYENKIFDLSLRKFITTIQSEDEQKKYQRVPDVKVEELASGTDTTATYEHSKKPIGVSKGDIVTYTIRVYNEGEIDGYVTSIKDHIPEQLEFLEEDPLNIKYGWKLSDDGKTVSTDITSPTTDNSANRNEIYAERTQNGTTDENKVLLKAFLGEKLDYIDVQIRCKVKDNAVKNQKITNIAEIADFTDADKKDILDRDSTEDSLTQEKSKPEDKIPNDNLPADSEFPTYKDTEIEKGDKYIPGQQDDDDFEKLYVVEVLGDYNLELEKVDAQNNTKKLQGAQFKVTVNGGEPQICTTDAQGKMNINKIGIEEAGEQTITIEEIKAPEGYSNTAGTITLKVTVKEQDGAYIIEDVKVSETKGLTMSFESGKISLTLKNYMLDLALRKFIIKIENKEVKTEDKYTREPQISAEELEKLENGDKTTAEKVHPKNPLTVKTGDRVIYVIRVYNEGEIPAYVKEVTDYLPEGLKFVEDSDINKNYHWTNPTGDGKTIKTDYLKNDLLDPFDGTKLDYRDLQIECEVIATENSQSLKNIAEITKHSDEHGDETVQDRDSTPDNVDKENYEDKSQQDDDDFEDLVLNGEYFDLSLRKFITEINTGTEEKKYDRSPKVNVEDLRSGKSTTATYEHPKDPISVSNGDIVTYTIRVYNEGQIDGYVTKITDHLPEQLEFIVNDSLNAKYGWEVSADGRTVTTDITSPKTKNSANRDEIYKDRREEEDKVLLKAFDETRETLDYIDVQIRCKVKDNIDLYEKITNIAEITESTDKDGNPVEDRDSTEDSLTKDNSKPEDKVPDDNLPKDEDLPEYKDPEIEREDKYIPGQQDDDDFEKLVLRRFDLALRKFITAVDDKEITNRVPVFNKVSDTEYKYEHPKDPVEVANGNIVTYTLRIFNEGNTSGYASKVKDDLPEGLQYLPDNELNKEYRWKMYTADGTETEDVNEAEYIETDYLSKEQEKEEGANLIKAFDPETMTMPDYKDIKIAFRVTEPNTSDRILTNIAEITDDTDEDGNPVEDVDSEPNNDDEDEDDIDKEHVKVKYFDLSLKKWVSESIVTYNGKTTVTKTGHTGDENPEPPAKVELKANQLSKTTVKFKFIIKITNEGEIAGYAKEIIDYIPQGLVFKQADNPKWREEDGKVLTDQLKDTLLQPGESATVEIILTWENNKNNLGQKTNWAEIYKDENEYNSPDIDSTPGNNTPGEDDIDDAPVILTIKTGSEPTYVVLGLTTVAMLTSGVILIKKFVI